MTETHTTESIEILEPEVVTDAPEESVAERAVVHALRRRRGMTLVEIMIVLTILAGIMVTVGVFAFDALDRANIKNTQLKLRKVAQKVQEYYAFKTPNEMPDSLDNLVNPPGGEPPYLKQEDVQDAWGREMSFERKGDRSFVIRSAGPDGDDGSQDDIILEE